MSRNAIIALLVLGVLGAMTASADQVVSDQSDAGRERKRSAIIVPFAFSTEALQTGIGAVYFRKGNFQPQDGLFLMGYGTSNSSFGL